MEAFAKAIDLYGHSGDESEDDIDKIIKLKEDPELK